MSTPHLFKEYLQSLEERPPVGCYDILVVGTFNAKLDGNKAQWFYGRPENEFWSLFPRMLGFPSLHSIDRDETGAELKELWVNFCKENRVVVVDLFKEVLIDMPNHSDSHLKSLQDKQYIPFNFEKAFQNCQFKSVMFTWEGLDNNRKRPCLLTKYKNQYIDYFATKGSRMVHLLTPSNAYAKPRSFKLKQWKVAYTENG